MVSDIDLENVDIKSISEAQLPGVVRSQCEILTELDQKLEIAFQKASGAQRSANVAANVKVGIIRGKKKAIQASQQGLVDLADANAANTEAIKVVYEYQKQIASIMKWLFNLGTISLAMNRATINQLKIVLKDGASVRLSDATKAELKAVIRDLKAQEDFMQKQAKTETAVKGHEKRLNRVEKHQKFLFGGVILALLLIVVVGVVASRAHLFSSGPSSAETQPPLTLESKAPLSTPASEVSEATGSQAQEPPANESFTVQGKESILPQPNEPTSHTDMSADFETTPPAPDISAVVKPSAVPASQPKPEIDLTALVGEAFAGDAYTTIYEQNGTYYFNFVVSSGSRICTLFPAVPLVVDGNRAVATYEDDGQGNSGSIQIDTSQDGKYLITAQVNNKWLSQYDDYGNLNALILDQEELHYNSDIKNYPIYKEYLAPEVSAPQEVDISFLPMREYSSFADDGNILTFSLLDSQSATLQVRNSDTDELIYQGTVSVQSAKQEYVILTGYDEISPSVHIEVECHYEGFCRVKTSDGRYNFTVFEGR